MGGWRYILIIIVCIPMYAEAYTQKITKPRAITFSSPPEWVKGEIYSGNTLVSLITPQGLPSAECAIAAIDFPSIRGKSQSSLNKLSLDPPDKAEMSNHLSTQYNNVKILSSSSTLVSGYPAHLYNVQYSVGTKTGEAWVRGIITTFATTPGLIWSVSCGGTGSSAIEALKNYSHWQLDMNLFVTKIKFESSRKYTTSTGSDDDATALREIQEIMNRKAK